jgi:hypothetical protein
VPRPDRDWSRLSAGARRRWVGAFGGPRSLGPERRAERARLAYGAGARLPVEHTGHAGPREAIFSQLVTVDGAMERVTVGGYTEIHRAAQHAHDVGALQRGRVTPADFKRRWSRRGRRVAGFALESTPARVIAETARAGPPSLPFVTYPVPPRRRAPRRSR